MSMKKIIVLLVCVLPIGTYAVCFRSFDITGRGATQMEAERDAQAQAEVACGSDSHNWSVRRTGFFYMQDSREVTATAQYQCCVSW